MDRALEYDHMMLLLNKLNRNLITDQELEQLKRYQKRFDELASAKIERLLKERGI